MHFHAKFGRLLNKLTTREIRGGAVEGVGGNIVTSYQVKAPER